MKILIDMNLSPAFVKVFENADIDSIHWSSVGDVRATDRSIMKWAKTNDYIVFTHDLDFGALLAATQAEAPSVIQIRSQEVLPDQISKLVIAALRQFETQLEVGALVTIDESQARARILPILSKRRQDEADQN